MYGNMNGGWWMALIWFSAYINELMGYVRTYWIYSGLLGWIISGSLLSMIRTMHIQWTEWKRDPLTALGPYWTYTTSKSMCTQFLLCVLCLSNTTLDPRKANKFTKSSAKTRGLSSYAPAFIRIRIAISTSLSNPAMSARIRASSRWLEHVAFARLVKSKLVACRSNSLSSSNSSLSCVTRKILKSHVPNKMK